MQRKNIQRDSRIDYGLILPVFLLTLVGMLSLYVAYFHEAKRNITEQLTRQGGWILLGIVLVLIVIHFSSKLLWKLTPFFYLAGLGLMVLPLIFYDNQLVSLTGAKNWVSIGGHTLFQPSELMKIVFVLMLAYISVRHNSKYTTRTLKTDFLLLAKQILCTFPVAILLKLQSDLGTMLVFFAILAGVIMVSGVSWKILLPLILIAAAVLFAIIFMVQNPAGREILSKFGVAQYQFNRIDDWLKPFNSSSTSAYQQRQALIAIGSAGLFGKGFNVTNVSVPVRESDMIFTVIAENFGFVGSAVVIFLYFMLIYRMIQVTYDSNNEFYSYISTGVIMMILFHVVENIGATIGLLPLTGIPLPFISAGGSAMVSNLIGIGLILSMKYHAQKKRMSQGVRLLRK
ncbi:MAG: FtsW/RodA/SpoVE family cell cycle protein [Streptococcaceae bacterium]|jgi:rod shape determining protein RodA|nr:FtsW/RodA/SpoVE family cell cycle protein [Streptococcaceae bacterium]